jgi:hypothetical protein
MIKQQRNGRTILWLALGLLPATLCAATAAEGVPGGLLGAVEPVANLYREAREFPSETEVAKALGFFHGGIGYSGAGGSIHDRRKAGFDVFDPARRTYDNQDSYTVAISDELGSILVVNRQQKHSVDNSQCVTQKQVLEIAHLGPGVVEDTVPVSQIVDSMVPRVLSERRTEDGTDLSKLPKLDVTYAKSPHKYGADLYVWSYPATGNKRCTFALELRSTENSENIRRNSVDGFVDRILRLFKRSDAFPTKTELQSALEVSLRTYDTEESGVLRIIDGSGVLGSNSTFHFPSRRVPYWGPILYGKIDRSQDEIKQYPKVQKMIYPVPSAVFEFDDYQRVCLDGESILTRYGIAFTKREYAPPSSKVPQLLVPTLTILETSDGPEKKLRMYVESRNHCVHLVEFYPK